MMMPQVGVFSAICPMDSSNFPKVQKTAHHSREKRPLLTPMDSKKLASFSIGSPKRDLFRPFLVSARR
ncbi:hypothetical protein RHGRI_011998 [Rhododendron griersonianum]|uniref:Uncharacterized protein n=1 Tax=Rhododendron griersonianum TaxID=479676 RepID=A0AAV6KQJ6_9ERIC|nr:hypothetical protein RHGRI_011998 [Rhododendron griersonianum]